MILQSIGSCLTVLEKFLLQSSPVVGSIVMKENIQDMSYKVETAAEIVGVILGIQNISKFNKLLGV